MGALCESRASTMSALDRIWLRHNCPSFFNPCHYFGVLRKIASSEDGFFTTKIPVLLWTEPFQNFSLKSMATGNSGLPFVEP